MANENNTVLDETKKILEMMAESEERITVLQQQLSQKEDLLVQLSYYLKELKTSCIVNSVTIEDNNDLKNNIEKCNDQLENFAQQVYTNLQEVCTDCIVNENELDELDEAIKICEEQFDQKVDELNTEKEELKKELQMVNDAVAQKHEKEELESQMLAAENEELKKELREINIEIEKYEEIIKEGETLDQDIEHYTEEISKLQEIIDGVISTSQELEEMEEEKRRIEMDSEKSICELNTKIEDIQSEATNLTEVLKKNKTYDLELSNQLKNLEEGNETLAKENEICEKELNSMQMIIRELQEKEVKENVSFIAFRKEHETYMLSLREIHEKLAVEIELFKGKYSQQVEKLEKLFVNVKYSEERLSKINLKQELEEKQEELKVLKSAHLEIKEKYSKKCLEQEIESKKVQEEIVEIEMKNRELHKNIDLIETEINQLKVKEEVLKIEKENLECKSKELDNQIVGIRINIAKIKIEKSKLKLKVPTDSKPFLKPSTSKAENKRDHHWDSDSSVEGENRRFSEIAKQKLKKKLQKKC